ncbi:MAG: hypothetical protein JWO69_806, partial [Thermoleophilia bacterium]|nr:hypothetical protein [Thermoleophilia bacterium]
MSIVSPSGVVTPYPPAQAPASCCGQATTGGGPIVAEPPSGDLATAVAALGEAVQQLQAVVDALQGATLPGAPATLGGGPGAGSPVQTPIQSPIQTAPPQPVDQAPPAPPSVREKIVAAARAELDKGVKEDAGADTDSGGNIQRYRSAVTGGGEDPNAPEPWCADFASYVWKQAGVPFGPEGKGEDYTVAMVDYARKQGSWQARGSAEPKPGDMILMDWDTNGAPNHV